MIGTNLFLALQRLHPDIEFDFVSYGPAFVRYRRAFADLKAGVMMKPMAPDKYWRNAASSLVARSSLARGWPALGSLTCWTFALPKRSWDGCNAVVMPWAHRHLPPPEGVRAVAGMMDITCLRAAPQGKDPIVISWRNNMLANLQAWLASGHRLTAISETTVGLISKFTGAARERITAVPIVGKDISAAAPWPAEWTWGAAPFVVYPANLSPHKNHEALFKAFQLVKSAYTLVLAGSGVRLQAGAVGRLDRRQRELADYARSCGLVPGKNLVSLDYVSEEMYRALLSRSQALIMPSLMEGFGLPVDEAMRAGIPVLCSDIPVFREVVALAGGEATWFDPASPGDIARALVTLRDNYTELKRRAVEKAATARRRTWKDVAERYWELINQK
jgi:glycosyltransferase involved in cell wall biosynthesis